MRVAMIGTGYVGLVSGACFADFGHEVTCVDKDKAKIDALKRGEMPIYEPGLNDLVAVNVRAGRLEFTSGLAPAVKAADAVFSIGAKFMHAGPGFGGSCFPKDTVALLKTGQDNATPLRIVEAVVAVNEARKRAMARKVAHALGGEVRGKTIAVLGLTFKPNTDDMRESPSIPLITALQDMGAKVRVYDPAGMEQAKGHIGNVAFCQNAYSCVEGASALVIVTEWEEFRALDFDRLKATMEQPVLVDLRNVYRPEEAARAGFVYESVGRARKPDKDSYPL